MKEEVKTADYRMLEEVREGLSRSQKRLPSKYFYDKRGSELFEQITTLPEYYPTRTEINILNSHLDEIIKYIGKRAVILELGSGSSKKTRLLLDHLEEPAAYIPVDISKEYLLNISKSLADEYPELPVKPVVADYTRPFELPEIEEPYSRVVAFYPGSTIGNFEPEEARIFLGQIRDITDPNGGLLIGVDLKKDRETIEEAYNDSQGVTAEFNKNILQRLNRELGTDFQLDGFEHKAIYNEPEGRIEMHLVSNTSQKIRLNGEYFEIEKGETIHTENSYKYSLEEFENLVGDLFRVEKVWTDPEELFSLQYLAA